MKKFFSLLLILILAIGIVGCGANDSNGKDGSNSTSSEDLEKGKEALANKDYNKALELFDSALSKDKSNNEATTLSSIVDTYLRAKKAVVHNNFEEAKTILDNINGEYTQYAIKDDIDALKSEVYKNLKERGESITSTEKGNQTTTEKSNPTAVEKNSSNDNPTSPKKTSNTKNNISSKANNKSSKNTNTKENVTQTNNNATNNNTKTNTNSTNNTKTDNNTNNNHVVDNNKIAPKADKALN